MIKGTTHTAEHKRKISEALTGITRSVETRKKMSIAKKNMSLATRKKISESKSGERHPMFGKCHSAETRKKMSEAQVGERHHMFEKHLSEKHKKKISAAMTGKIVSEETRRKLSIAHLGRRPSEESKKKMRLAKLARLERIHGQLFPSYNPIACKLIEEYGERHGYSFQHAENGGEFHIKELGYWVDGYDSKKNVVIEVYEPAHSRQKERDLIRQQEITSHLGCEFIVLKCSFTKK